MHANAALHYVESMEHAADLSVACDISHPPRSSPAYARRPTAKSKGQQRDARPAARTAQQAIASQAVGVDALRTQLEASQQLRNPCRPSRLQLLRAPSYSIYSPLTVPWIGLRGPLGLFN